MENVFDHFFRFLKNFEVKAEPKTRKKKRWLLSREYLQPLEDSDDENLMTIHDDRPLTRNERWRQAYEAAKYGMKQGVLTGVFIGGCWGIFQKLREPTSADDSEGREKRNGKTEIDTRSYTVIREEKRSKMNTSVEEPSKVPERTQDVTNTRNDISANKVRTNRIDADYLSDRAYDYVDPDRYAFMKPVEKIEIVGYAFIETTGPLSNTHSGSGSNQSDGSDSSGSATVRMNDNKNIKKPVGLSGKSEDQQKRFQREESFRKTSQSSSGISDSIKHSVVSMAEKSIKTWKNLEKNESEILTKVEPNQSQDLSKWADYSISSLPEMFLDAKFSPIDFEKESQLRASVIKSLPRSASVLDEPIDRFERMNILSSTYSKSVDARSSKNRKHELKWGKIFEKPRVAAPDYESDHNFITTLKLSFLVDADAVSNGYDSDVTVNSMHLADDREKKIPNIGAKPVVLPKKSSLMTPKRGTLSPKKTQDKQTVSPTDSKAFSKPILKHSMPEKSSAELGTPNIHKTQKESMFDIGSPESYVDETSTRRTSLISTSEFSESQMTEFKVPTSSDVPGHPHIGPYLAHHRYSIRSMLPDSEEQYENESDLTHAEEKKFDHGVTKVNFLDNKPVDHHPPKISGLSLLKPRDQNKDTVDRNTTEGDLTNSGGNSPKISKFNLAKPRDQNKDTVDHKVQDTKTNTDRHSPQTSHWNFPKPAAKEAEHTRPHTAEKTDRGKINLPTIKSHAKETTDRHSPKVSTFKLSKPRSEEQEDSRPRTTDQTDRSYSKIDFTLPDRQFHPADTERARQIDKTDRGCSIIDFHHEVEEQNINIANSKEKTDRGCSIIDFHKIEEQSKYKRHKIEKMDRGSSIINFHDKTEEQKVHTTEKIERGCSILDFHEKLVEKTDQACSPIKINTLNHRQSFNTSEEHFKPLTRKKVDQSCSPMDMNTTTRRQSFKGVEEQFRLLNKEKTDRGGGKIDSDKPDRNSPQESRSRFFKSEIPRPVESRRFTEPCFYKTTLPVKSQNTESTNQSSYKIPKPVPIVPMGLDRHSPKDSLSELPAVQRQSKFSTGSSSYVNDKIMEEISEVNETKEISETSSPSLIIPEISETDQLEYNEISSAYFGPRTIDIPTLTRKVSLGAGSRKSTVTFTENLDVFPSEKTTGVAVPVEGPQAVQQTEPTEQKLFRSFNFLSSFNENIIVLSACNCAIVLGVICCIVSTARATLAV